VDLYYKQVGNGEIGISTQTFNPAHLTQSVTSVRKLHVTSVSAGNCRPRLELAVGPGEQFRKLNWRSVIIVWRLEFEKSFGSFIVER
jgi:hypothetical protein